MARFEIPTALLILLTLAGLVGIVLLGLAFELRSLNLAAWGGAIVGLSVVLGSFAALIQRLGQAQLDALQLIHQSLQSDTPERESKNLADDADG